MAKKNKELSVPTVSDAEIAALQSTDDEIRASGLVNITKLVLPDIPKNFAYPVRERAFVKDSFMWTFELIGGLRRFAMWANENPDEFYKLYARMMPEAEKASPLQQQIVINTSVPRSGLDDVDDLHVVVGQHKAPDA